MADKPLTRARAEQLTLRAHLALFIWIAVAGGLALLGLLLVVLALSGVQPAEAGLAGLATVWFGVYVVACAVVVWSYRCTIGPLAARGRPGDLLQAEARSRVTWHFVGAANLAGVDIGHNDPTRLAVLVNSTWVLVGHVGAIGLVVLAAARAG